MTLPYRVEAIIRGDLYPPSAEYLARIEGAAGQEHESHHATQIGGATYGCIVFRCRTEAKTQDVLVNLLVGRMPLVSARRVNEKQEHAVCRSESR